MALRWICSRLHSVKKMKQKVPYYPYPSGHSQMSDLVVVEAVYFRCVRLLHHLGPCHIYRDGAWWAISGPGENTWSKKQLQQLPPSPSV